MTAIIIIVVVIALFLLFGASASRAAAHSPLPRPPLSRRDIPLDPIIDLGLDPLIEPWADDVPVRLRSDELIIDDDSACPLGSNRYNYDIAFMSRRAK